VANDSDEYTLFAYVSEANRPQPVGTLQNRSVREARSPDVIVGEFDVSTLASGSYFLRIAVLNRQNEAVVEQARKFFVYNPGVQREETPAVEMDFETSPYAAMPEEEVALGLEHISIISNESDRRRIRRIVDLNEKRRFLMEFWQKRDDQPGTPINEFREEFYRRLQYSNDRYSSNRQEGWRTDRGRVVIRYGLPTSIDPHLYDRNAKPHEIWQYNNIPGEGQAIFVFADLSGFGDFELLHSSVTGERSLPDWQQQLGRR
ncbi:MAG: GWxTD domain-containing protein, partial [Rhodothermales bacterium]